MYKKRPVDQIWQLIIRSYHKITIQMVSNVILRISTILQYSTHHSNDPQKQIDSKLGRWQTEAPTFVSLRLFDTPIPSHWQDEQVSKSTT